MRIFNVSGTDGHNVEKQKPQKTQVLQAFRMVRMLRVVRQIRLLRMFRDLWTIVKGEIVVLRLLPRTILDTSFVNAGSITQKQQHVMIRQRLHFPPN